MKKRIELLEKRKAKEKHFLQEDGSIVAVMYNDNVHFKKNGKYEEIDNTLNETNINEVSLDRVDELLSLKEKR